MRARIDTSTESVQHDIWASGLAREITPNGLTVWFAIKSHADYNTGVCWPGVRHLSEITGLSTATVSRTVALLESKNLLRVVKGKGRKSSTYIARERLDVRLGDKLLCRLVIDYVPSHLRQRLEDIQNALDVGAPLTDAFAACEIIPAEGFVWDAEEGVLKSNIAYSDLPAAKLGYEDDELASSLAYRVKQLQSQAAKKGS